MFSESDEKLDVQEFFNNYKEPAEKSPQLDVIIEHYLSLMNHLKQDLNVLREDLTEHKKIKGEISDSFEEFLSIQKLSAIITQSQAHQQIAETLDEICQKVIPHDNYELFSKVDNRLEPIKKKPEADFLLLLKSIQEEGILDWLWDQGHPIVVPVTDFLIYDKLRFRLGNIIISPMIINNQGVGIYLFYAKKEQANFSLRDLELLNILTQQAAIAIQYTNMYTKLEKAHESLKSSQHQLMRSLKLATVGELAGGIAHEINNPLQIIMGNIQVARMGHKVEESLKVIETQAMRIANIVRGLLNMARQNNNESSSEFIEVNSLIMNTVNLVRGQIEKRNIDINLDLGKKIPVLKCSSVYFQQVLLNFILHAKKQINQDGTLDISSSVDKNNWIHIEIIDSGAALPREYVQKVMDPFSDLENSTETNLGLTVSVQMIRDLGGVVKIESTDESGNKIIIKIPKGTEKMSDQGKEAVSTG
jgi:signal transduction histidine kinase